jgi:signal transduction histidine kinase
LWQVDLRQGPAARPQRVAGTAALDQLDVLVLEPARNGMIWIGTRSHGVYRYDPIKQSLLHVAPKPAEASGLAHHFITSMLSDRRGWLWVGTYGGGLNLCRQPDQAANLQFVRIGSAQGLPNPIVDKVLEDTQGHVWVSTDAGLASIDAKTLAIRLHGRADGGAIGMFFRNAGANTAHGELLFGGDTGLVVVRPERLSQWDYSPPVVISELQVGGKVRPVGRLNQLGPALGQVVVPADGNSLTAEFSALDFSTPAHNRYAYRLDGVDRDWIETSATRRLASYANLAPGTYQLHLRGSNRNGVWARQERVLSVRVLPAWYQTWWFYTLLALLTLLLMATMVQVRTRFLRQRQEELKAQVEQGIVALRQKQAQLVQQEKMASLGTLTAGIAHEINNPSNFAHVGAYNLGNELADLHRFLLKLAGDEASPELLQALQKRFDNLAASLGAISEGTTRIRDLVRDLRTFSRLDEADWKSAAIGDSLLATVNLVRTQYADQVEMRCELAANPEIECWPAQLNQVFMNLIVNACQAIISRAPEVRAAVPGRLLIRSWQEVTQEVAQEVAQERKNQQTMLVLEFADNGVGIAPELLEKIFDPFFTTKTVGEGMGMGLSISFGIIAKHHGSMSVSSTLGQGACFTLRLPIPADTAGVVGAAAVL